MERAGRKLATRKETTILRTTPTTKIYIGIDNGVTGSFGILGMEAPYFFHTPVVSCLNYTKEEKHIHRVDWLFLFSLLEKFKGLNVLAVMERPMVNPGRFAASVSALRAFESTIIALEFCGIPYVYVDSKQWQKVLLPGVVGSDELKKASLELGKELFPQFSKVFKKDADGILIAEWARRTNL